MAYCRQCGAALQEGTKFCSECGAPTDNTPIRTAEPQIVYQAEKPKKRKSIFKRWWFWVLALLVIAVIAGRSGAKMAARPTGRQTVPTAASDPQTTRKAAEAPAEGSEPQAAPSENEIRPEVKEFLDAYEACMDEYVEFMRKYMDSDPASSVSMMGDYYSILARYTEFAEKMEAFDEEELTNAELAYYLEVTNRVSHKLLSVAG